MYRCAGRSAFDGDIDLVSRSSKGMIFDRLAADQFSAAPEDSTHKLYRPESVGALSPATAGAMVDGVVISPNKVVQPLRIFM